MGFCICLGESIETKTKGNGPKGERRAAFDEVCEHATMPRRSSSLCRRFGGLRCPRRKQNEGHTRLLPLRGFPWFALGSKVLAFRV